MASDLLFNPNVILPFLVILWVENDALLDEFPVVGHDELEISVEIAIYVALGRVLATGQLPIPCVSSKRTYLEFDFVYMPS